MTTIYDVGRMAGVSRSTVSRVLNSKGEVDPKTAELVWEAVRKLNYHPNASARALVRKRTDMIGVMLAEVSDPFYEKIVKGIESVVNERNMGVFFYNSYDNLDDHKLIISSALEGSQVDGLVVVGSNLGDRKTLLEIINQGLPIAFIERYFTDAKITCVICDNKQGASAAVEYLLELGHRRIGCITGNLHLQTGIDRLDGYKSTLQKYGLPVEEELIALGNYQHSSGYEGMKQLLTLPEKPTAVFAANDMMAIGAILAIKEMGLLVPEDISVVGYDDITFAPMVYPQLTTIRQPLFEMGVLAARGLIDRITMGEQAEIVKRILPAELIVRKSTRPLV
jgi:DNA-binding LacI/PurR family transcriptional regulator